MKVGVVSNTGYCIPVLQFLRGNGIEASVFMDASSFENSDKLKYFCDIMSLPVFSGSKDDLYSWIKREGNDIVFVMGYRHLIDIKRIPEKLLSGLFNIHFGPLPEFKGPQPVFWQLKLGKADLTVAIHRINRKFDDGEVVWAKSLKKEPHHSYGMVHMLLAYLTLEGIGLVLSYNLQKKELPALSKKGSVAKYYNRPRQKDVFIDWDRMTAESITDLISACNPWNKGAVTLFNGNAIKLVDAELLPDVHISYHERTPGTIINDEGCLHVLCLHNKVLSVNMMSDEEGTFLPGRFASLSGLVEGQKFSN